MNFNARNCGGGTVSSYNGYLPRNEEGLKSWPLTVIRFEDLC